VISGESVVQSLDLAAVARSIRESAIRLRHVQQVADDRVELVFGSRPESTIVVPCVIDASLDAATSFVADFLVSRQQGTWQPVTMRAGRPAFGSVDSMASATVEVLAGGVRIAATMWDRKARGLVLPGACAVASLLATSVATLATTPVGAELAAQRVRGTTP
jgi:hypothetical protein